MQSGTGDESNTGHQYLDFLLLGHKFSLIRNVLTSSKLTVCVCEELLNEIKDVASRSKIRKYVEWSEVELLIQIMELYCMYAVLNTKVTTNIRAPKDVYLLALAEQLQATLIVSGDKDLLDLKRYKTTEIMTWADFLLLMESLGITDKQ